MKLHCIVLIAAAAACVAGERLESTYLPPQGAGTAGGNGQFLNAPHRKAGGSYSAGGGASTTASRAAPIAILRLNNENNGDGTYQFDFETENHITQQESGQLRAAGPDGEAAVVQGSFSFAGDDGQTYSISYMADENGFRPEGAHLPTAPPVPAEILKALEQNAADEAAGIVDDGQYRAEHAPPQAAPGAPSRQYLGPKPGQNQQGGYKY